ncbi:unnamed protein product [marine sediment metagenome]|uniref:Uncharacterized protein n=1 Tax=marine sediment metagenome TaxID=412755 RepID=X0UFA2_9ZZZZ
MKRISEDKIAEVAVVCWVALEEHERMSFRLVANEQLESCHQELWEFIAEIEKLDSTLCVHEYEPNLITVGRLRTKHLIEDCRACKWQALKEKLRR